MSAGGCPGGPGGLAGGAALSPLARLAPPPLPAHAPDTLSSLLAMERACSGVTFMPLCCMAAARLSGSMLFSMFCT